jgi:predicted PurR-regulated permease PerM
MSLPPPSPQQANLIWLSRTGTAIAVLVGLAVGAVWGIGKVLNILSPVIWPIAVAGVLSYLLDPAVGFFEGKTGSRARAIICVFGLGFVIVLAAFGSVAPRLLDETQQLADGIPSYATKLQQRFQEWAAHPPPWAKWLWEHGMKPAAAPGQPGTGNSRPAENTTNAVVSSPSPSTNAVPSLEGALDADKLQAATGYAAKYGPIVGKWVFGQVWKVASWFGVLAGLALVPVYAFYFLLEKRGIVAQWTDYLPVSDSGFKRELVFVLESINNYLIAFFRGQLLVAMIDGLLYGIGFLLIGLPYAVLIGGLAMLLTMIPFLGAIIVCSSALVISLVSFGDWQHPLMTLGVFGVVQALEGLVVSPRIMGGRVGLHPVTIIIAVMAGTTLLGGLLGGILAIPLTAALRVLMFRYVWKRTKESAS